MCARSHGVDIGKVSTFMPESTAAPTMRELHHNASAHLARPLGLLWLPDAFFLAALGDHCLASHTAEFIRLRHVLGSVYCPSFVCFFRLQSVTTLRL